MKRKLIQPDHGYWSVFRCDDEDAIEFLREITIDAMNFVLFSTSGVSGSYLTIEECAEIKADVSYCFIQPRIWSMTCGEIPCVDHAVVEMLKEIRKNSWLVMASIGK